jgi:ABC-2 type transport system ATP-binding protein
MSIKVNFVSKSYKGQRALHEVSFFAGKGQIIGFLGPNGAGKSTMMKILTGYLQPDMGTVIVDGINVLKTPLKAQQIIGYLPENNPLYTAMYVREYLQFQAAIYKISKVQIEICIGKVGLEDVAHKKIHELSKGYRQRVGLAAAILHNPKVLILDEPTTGLDPNQILEIRALIKILGKDKTILFSTHIMQEVEALCERVIIIKEGMILADRKLAELQKNQKQVIEVSFNIALLESDFNDLSNLEEIKSSGENTWCLTFNNAEDMRGAIFDFAQAHKIKILSLNALDKNLETLFREITNKQ